MPKLKINSQQSREPRLSPSIVNRGSRPSRHRLAAGAATFAEDFRRKLSIFNRGSRDFRRQSSIVNHNNSAFTLIELLVAIFLAAMIMLITAMIFKQASKAFSESDARNEVYQNVRAAFGIIKRDISGAILNIDNEYFNGGTNTITFLSSTSNDNDQPITLIKYFLNGNTLNKSENTDTATLNASISSFGIATGTGFLGFNVSTLQFMYREGTDSYTTWDSTAKGYLPDAVEVKMTISDMQNRYTGTSTSIISIR